MNVKVNHTRGNNYTISDIILFIMPFVSEEIFYKENKLMVVASDLGLHCLPMILLRVSR